MSHQYTHAIGDGGRGTSPPPASTRWPSDESNISAVSTGAVMPESRQPEAGPPAYPHSRRGRRPWVEPAVWQHREMRLALATRDLRIVYRLLQAAGVSQRQIAARTDQSQSEISEIIKGRRKVSSYELFLRVADGLPVPRGWMGLDYDRETVEFLRSGVTR